MESLELLWNQAWENGGYGRYHFRSEPDSPGGWAFPSLFMARAYLEMGEYEKVWRVLEWLNSVPGSRSGSWFEFYGKRIAPPYPQVGIPPWTWAEMIILLVYHVLGIRPSEFGLWIRPKILPGIHTIRGSFPFRGKKLKIEIQKKPGLRSICFDTKENILEKSKEKILISFPKKDIEIHVDVP
jgi:cellobiose phosphorylase